MRGQVIRLADADVSGDCSAPLVRFELAAIVACCQPGFPLHGVLVGELRPPHRIDAAERRILAVHRSGRIAARKHDTGT